MRKYRTGSTWALWRWSEVDSEYITRLHIVKTPWFAICLHWLHKPDPEPFLHDHPVTFLSVILRGGYCEWRSQLEADGLHHTRWRNHSFLNFIRASSDDRHRIIFVVPDTLTLCLMGPKTREWGFHTPNGWQYWRDYYADQRAAREKLSTDTSSQVTNLMRNRSPSR